MAVFRWGSHWDPLWGLRAVQREMERLSRPWSGESRRVGGGAYPPVNVFESEKEILVQCEVAGVEPEDLDLTITGETLTIKGVKKPIADTDDVKFVRRERGSGDFTRTIVLPDEVDADRIDASLTNGIMTIRLPKTGAPVVRSIKVKAREVTGGAT